jgi:hypothetical protein
MTCRVELSTSCPATDQVFEGGTGVVGVVGVVGVFDAGDFEPPPHAESTASDTHRGRQREIRRNGTLTFQGSE